jgi:DNA-binding NarL/FixJ family response regulator
VDTVQKQIGLLISAVGLSMGVANVIYSMLHFHNTFWQALGMFTVWSLFLFTLVFLVSVFVESRVLKIFQVLIFFLVGTFSILSSYEQFYGPAMFLVAWLLMRHYDYLENHARSKNALFLVVLTGLSQVSANLHTDEGVYAGLATLLYSVFLIAVLIIIWRDLVRQQQELKKENRSLQMDYHRLSALLTELEGDQKPFDLKAAKISPAEARIIETLTVYKASNREIAERLNLAESTVKLHLYNIYNKIGVDNRFAIIDLCKYNFAEKAV